MLSGTGRWFGECMASMLREGLLLRHWWMAERDAGGWGNHRLLSHHVRSCRRLALLGEVGCNGAVSTRTAGRLRLKEASVLGTVRWLEVKPVGTRSKLVLQASSTASFLQDSLHNQYNNNIQSFVRSSDRGHRVSCNTSHPMHQQLQ